VLSEKLRNCTVAVLLVGVALARSNAPPDLLTRVRQQIQQGNLDSARHQLKLAIKEFPADPSLYNLLGIVEAQSGSRSAAEADFKKALVHAPNSTGTLLNLGRLYLQYASEDSKAPGQALDVYQKVLRNEPDNVEALYQSAALLATTGSFQKSLNHLSQLPADVQEKAQVLSIRCADESGLGHPKVAADFAERLLKSPDLSHGCLAASAGP
jgi:tetratricopeptide (TPR) repeat protein